MTERIYMKKHKIKNPLIKRIPKELLGDWKKYLVVGLFLILMIGFVSGVYVANSSMLHTIKENKTKYKQEDGFFELNHKANDKLLSAIQSGKKANLKKHYTDKAKKELNEKFENEFKKEFDKEFNSKFKSEFDKNFEQQIKESFTEKGMNEEQMKHLLPAAIEQAKNSNDYLTAYDNSYKTEYKKAYDESYPKEYEKAWKKIQKEIEESYAEAEKKYKLNDSDFKVTPVTVYETFYKNETEDYNNDGLKDGTIRIYAKNDEVNLACLMKGRFPENETEIAIDRMHADNTGIKLNNSITIGNLSYKVVGFISYANYYSLHEKPTEFMFDALKFDVAMVTKEGFDRLKSNTHYVYSWRYVTPQNDEKEEKKIADDFTKALLTQTIVYENEIIELAPAYINQAINFAPSDLGSDEAMAGVLLNILIVIIAFIFAITITNTIVREASVIGTLRASGYTKKELILHFLSIPVIVTVISAIIGNILGYTVFKNVVTGMYYNSYSLPAYKTVFNHEALFKTTIIPVILMFVVNLAVIIKMLQKTPLQFLRHDLKKRKRKKTIKLPKWNFLSRFRLRIIFQNIPNYVILFVGILFISVMLAMAVGLPYTLKFYKNNVKNMMFSNYQYILKSHEDENGTVINPENKEAEKFATKSLQKKNKKNNEEIAVYGISENSDYIKIDELSSLKENEVYISLPFAQKYDLKPKSELILDEKYENNHYSFKVAGIYDKSAAVAIFMPIHHYRSIFQLEEKEFNGYFSDSELTDIEEENIITVITERDITKTCEQLEHSMGAYMQYFQFLCILLSAVLIYLLTKIIIEKNENAISMTKILGYENREIASLYLRSTTITVLIETAIGVIGGAFLMSNAWKAMMLRYSGWLPFLIRPMGYVKMFLFIFTGYIIVSIVDFRRIKQIPMDEALKNIE